MTARRAVVVVCLVALVVLLLRLALRDVGVDPGAPAPRSGTETRGTSRPSKRVRATATDELADPALAADALFVDGWPAADVIVRRHDGTPAAGAIVYLHRAKGRCDANNLVARRIADDSGAVRFAAPDPGRYDVGAFAGPAGFSTVVPDVEFPARAPIVVVLPEMARLDIRSEVAIPPNVWINVTTARAQRIRALPGRDEDKYVSVATNPLADHVMVPRGVALRLHVGPYEAVNADPGEFSAPGHVTLRADRRVQVPIELVFIGPDPPTQPYAVEYALEAPAAEVPGPHAGSIAVVASQRPRPAHLDLRALPGSIELTVSVKGQPPFATSVFAAPLPAGARHSIEVPVRSWLESDAGFRVRLTRKDAPPPRAGHVLIGATKAWVLVGDERSCTMFPLGPVAAVGEAPPGEVLLSEAATPVAGRTLELVVVPGAEIRVGQCVRPAALDGTWLLTAERADGRPFVSRDDRVVTSTPIFSEASRIGLFPAGDVELVFRFAGREVGRRTVHVVPGPPILVDAPELVPPGRETR